MNVRTHYLLHDEVYKDRRGSQIFVDKDGTDELVVVAREPE